MQHFARSTCSRHINCHLRSLLCQQGSTSTAVQLDVCAAPSVRSRRWHSRQFSSSHPEAQDTADAQYTKNASDSAVPDPSDRQDVSSAKPLQRPFKRKPHRFRPPQAPPAGVFKDPVQAIERLSTMRMPARSSDKAFDEAFEALPVLAANSREVIKANERERRSHNEAVHKLLQGIAKDNWNTAFHKGWSALYARDGSHAKVNMDTVENLVRLWSVQSEEVIVADWETVLNQLLIPATLREVELQSEHTSVVATWMWSELAKNTATARRRNLTFWTTFVQYATEEGLGEKRGDPFYLLQIPSNLFSSALVAHFVSSATLREFIQSFHDTIAVPSGYKPSFAHEYIRRASERCRAQSAETPAISMDQEELGYWLRQMTLIRIWARVGDQSIRMACATWRERMHQAAVTATWGSLQEAVQRTSGDPMHDWVVIDWSTPDRTSPQEGSNEEVATPPVEDRQDLENERNDSHMRGREIWKQRPKLPVQFTPAIAAEFIRTLMHVDLLEEAEAVWNFVESLGLKPNIIMWTALLHGHLHRRDLNAAEAVFREMERTTDAKPDMTVRSLLATAYFRSDEIEAGRQAVMDMLAAASKRDKGDPITTRVYNNLLSGLLWNNNSAELAFQVFNQMQEEGTPVDIYTINILLRHYSRRTTFDLKGVTATLEVLSQNGIQPDTYTLSMLLDALLLAGRPDAVGKVQQIMENLDVQANTATYGGMINHLVKHGIKTGEENRLSTALELLRQMQASGESKTRPTEITYSALIQAFCRFSVIWNSDRHLEMGEALHDEMLELGIPPNRITYNSLMAAHLAKDNVAKALYYFSEYRQLKNRRGLTDELEEMRSAEVDASFTLRHNVSMRTWQALITGLVEKKRYGIAREVLQEMKELGIEIRSPAFQKVASLAMNHGKSIR